jgi:pimeloyl-ACP methyl ester carboxylesterase
MKPIVLFSAAIMAMGLSPAARAQGFPGVTDILISPDVSLQLGQLITSASQIKPAAIAKSMLPKPPSIPDAPVNFKFNSGSVKDKDAVVLSVCGLSNSDFWLDMASLLYYRIFPDNKTGAAAAPEQKPAVFQTPATNAGAPDGPSFDTPNDYLEISLRDRLSEAGKKYLVVPMPWTRNPQKSAEAIADFKLWLVQVCDAAHKNGKPVYVVAHSWGALLVYEAMAGLAKEGSPIRVDKFVTLGSPLGQWWLKYLAEIVNQGWDQTVSMPANVNTWYNYWAKRDRFSASIPFANGGNFQVDAPADSIQTMLLAKIAQNVNLTKACHDTRMAVEKDLAALYDTSAWHASYLYDYDKFFPSIGERLKISVFSPKILPRL